MTRCESYPLCSGTIYFPTAPSNTPFDMGIHNAVLIYTLVRFLERKAVL